MDASDGPTWNSGILSVISVTSVVPRSSCLPESSSRLGAPARPCGRGRLALFSLLQRFAVWWVALPWPILPVPAVLLALCRIVDDLFSELLDGALDDFYAAVRLQRQALKTPPMTVEDFLARATASLFPEFSEVFYSY